jgi:peptidoglycan/xylan/chitin deacetylase (PgdA/CDA1 family)
MDRRISRYEIRYLVDHLAMFYTGVNLDRYLDTEIASSGEEKEKEPAIKIPLSSEPLDVNKVTYIGEIPVLFPCSEHQKWFSQEGNGIYFHHDILKSAFYLLSGYQEYNNEELDVHGRFPWRLSVQYRLGFTKKPVVNYYFEVILEAFELFCHLNGLEFRRVQSEAPILFLSHDVDMIKKYSLRNLVYAGLQLLGIKPSTHPFFRRLKTVADYTKGTLFFLKDPYWNFRELMELEKELGITSTWYFLEKTKEDNSRYHFGDDRIRELIGELSSRGHEIGIHGTLESSADPQAMAGGIERIHEVCEPPVPGIRQHYLKYSLPVTTRIQQDCGFAYDSTLGFAEQIGFRNSFTHPFRLFDFDNGKSFGLWQLPLHVMEVTLLGYMEVALDAIPETIRPVVAEVRKFKGIFSLLWHNSNLDEEEFPGINRVYHQVLREVMDAGFQSMTGHQVIKSFGS